MVFNRDKCNRKTDIQYFEATQSYIPHFSARNEEKVIGNLIDSLYNQNYDKSLYKICVIPDTSS